MQLKSVVLPAPLGPISPITMPGSTEKLTSWLAFTPPKNRLTLRTSSIALILPPPSCAAAG